MLAMDFSDQVAVVTGGSRGIGAATVRMLAARGARVLFCYRERADAAQAVLTECANLCGEVQARQTDVRDKAQVVALIAEAVERWGRLDVLINNAAIVNNRLTRDMDLNVWHEVLAANLTSVYFTCKAALKPMMKARYGRIINMSSAAGRMGNAGQANYAAAKAGLIGLTKSVAKEYASRNILCNAVAPGFIETDMTAAMTPEAKTALSGQIPLERLGKPEDIANAVTFLCSEQAAYITGQVLVVDGGMVM